MKRYYFTEVLFYLVILGITICGCDNKSKKTSDVDIAGNMGMYVATLPCADCPGIFTHLTLNADSTAYLTTLYMDSDNTSETIDGRWIFTDSIFTVKASNGEVTMYKLLSENQLVQVGETKEVKKEYILTKEAEMLADSFVGTYSFGSDEKGAYRQTLKIAKVDDRHVEVAITKTGGKAKGCEFKAQGYIVNNQIEVNLKDVNPDMNSVMTICPLNSGDGLNVFTSKFDDRYDLMFFCGGGGILAGDYIKENH